MSRGKIWLLWALGCVLWPAGAAATDCDLETAAPLGAVLERAHAHNDYEHTRPLLDALDSGFTSVEADVWLYRGELVVTHTFPSLAPNTTLEALYLKPLAQRVRQNHGSVYAAWPHSVQLLIDIKSDAKATYLALHRTLERYRHLFTTFDHGRVRPGAVTAVISGNRPRELMQAQAVRYAAYDGRDTDLGGPLSAAFMPLISSAWSALFDWRGEGRMPENERRRLSAFVDAAHGRGQRVRFWETPDTGQRREAIWAELLAAGVDYINTDHLAALRSWLTEHDRRPAPEAAPAAAARLSALPAPNPAHAKL